MFRVNNVILPVDDIVVLQKLKDALWSQGIQRFSQFKIGTNNIQFTCPFHAGGQEKKPSCGISTRTTDKHPAGTVHCFTCGYVATLEQMISNCFGHDDYGVFGRQWLISTFLQGIGSRRNITFDFTRRKPVNTPSYISEEELDRYRYYHPYMRKRKLTDDIIDRFDVGYDKAFELAGRKFRCITFPVRDEYGGTLFVARRCIDQKLFHYPPNAVKPVYGLHELPPNANEIIICESIINALTCYVYGKPAVALLGLGTEAQYKTLRQLSCRKYIMALDPDTAGEKASIKLKNALDNKLVRQYVIPKGKDINDLTHEEFMNLSEVWGIVN